MGLIRDAIGAALGADQVNNGFNGPKDRLLNSASRYASSVTQKPPSRAQKISYANYSDQRSQYPSNNTQYDFSQDRAPVPLPRDEFPPRYELSADNDSRDLYERPVYNTQPYDPQSYYKQTPQRGMGYPGDINFAFRPIALPQISYGDREPFLQGYANELRQYGISERDFISLIDAINVTIIPNPENQIFQKGANIAGWFLPGAASIGLTLGQIGVGIGSSIGNNSAVARQLSKANLELFLPNGLELW
ncbi:hypothetical protein N7488_004488 [Penicillium malachiteum]|nr:hypothetical protein N7488_004488 [Penicillium malachiteum]